jgi:hypothetical protein
MRRGTKNTDRGASATVGCRLVGAIAQALLIAAGNILHPELFRNEMAK